MLEDEIPVASYKDGMRVLAGLTDGGKGVSVGDGLAVDAVWAHPLDWGRVDYHS
jgi:hypothetical protein